MEVESSNPHNSKYQIDLSKADYGYLNDIDEKEANSLIEFHFTKEHTVFDEIHVLKKAYDDFEFEAEQLSGSIDSILKTKKANRSTLATSLHKQRNELGQKLNQMIELANKIIVDCYLQLDFFEYRRAIEFWEAKIMECKKKLEQYGQVEETRSTVKKSVEEAL